MSGTRGVEPQKSKHDAQTLKLLAENNALTEELEAALENKLLAYTQAEESRLEIQRLQDANSTLEHLVPEYIAAKDVQGYRAGELAKAHAEPAQLHTAVVPLAPARQKLASGHTEYKPWSPPTPVRCKCSNNTVES